MSAPNLYDAVAYPGFAQAQTHPDRLSTIAALFGLAAAPSERCRVLEVGCGDGRNLIAMASALPASTFAGFDLAAQPIAAGSDVVARLGLKNVSLTRRDLMTVGAEIGTFDYVIAHGFYAWVPRPVQDRLLALCREVLAPGGIAYVSYNAYPGCRLREMLRDMMMFQLRGVDDPANRVAQAKAFIDFVRRGAPEDADYGARLTAEMERLVRQSPGTMFHDLLGGIYSPAYFHEFMAHAGAHALQYLGEADFLEMDEENLPPEAVDRLRAFGPDRIVEKEQLMDFLKLRVFRQTLLCRDSIALRRAPASEDLGRIHVATRAHPVTTPTGSVEYRTARGASMATDSPVLRTLMGRLESAWPGSLPFAELSGLFAGAAEAAQMLIRLYGSAMVDLHPSAPRFVLRAGATPSVSALVRVQIEQGPLVTNRLHADVKVDGDAARELVRRLDGTRDRPALLRDLAAAGQALSPESLEKGLGQLARLALLLS